MQITKRKTEITLDEQEQAALREAWNVLDSIVAEMDCDAELFGYNESDWTCILDGLDAAADDGKITIE